MIIDNRLRTGQYRMLYVIIMGMIVIALVYSIFEQSILKYYALGVAAFLVIFHLLLHLKKPHYFYFNDEKEKIVIRYYNAHPFLRKYKAIEIPKSQITDFQIVSTALGLNKSLIISIKSTKGEGDFPPVSLSGLNVHEIAKLKKNLTQLLIGKK